MAAPATGRDMTDVEVVIAESLEDDTAAFVSPSTGWQS